MKFTNLHDEIWSDEDQERDLPFWDGGNDWKIIAAAVTVMIIICGVILILG
jgi:hypothetical protein